MVTFPPARIGSALLLGLVCACAEPPWPTPDEETAAMELGAVAAEQLTGTLVRHLTTALDSAGTAGAIDFCSGQAPALTRRAAGSSGHLEIKRTSDRVRNPANAPDSLEAEALAYFADRLASGAELPRAWLQVEGDTAVRYYRPLVVSELCVQCHGPVTALASDVLAALAERYPTDHATGYLPGDFRGLIRVRIPRDAIGGREP